MRVFASKVKLSDKDLFESLPSKIFYFASFNHCFKNKTFQQKTNLACKIAL